ncbi:MAG: hypothetical protein HY833_00915 [Candidatus Aenigmarchaeota archaeon]|nr:hypothetical protein [Candidatus Aenigmarchaeota archaeon]
MAMKGDDSFGGKFDEFSIIAVGAIIFIGILLLAFSTPSEFPPTVRPLEVKMSLDPGSYESFVFNISGKVTGVNITTSGEIADWIQLSETDIGALRDKKSITATVNVPGIASPGTHRGIVTVWGKEGKADIQVAITVSSVKKLTSKTVPMGDFRVAYLAGSRALDTFGSTFVTKSYLYEKPLNLVGVIEDEEMPILTGASVRFIVEDANNYGPVIVTQNGRQIFSEVVGPGEVIVPLNMSDLRRSNTVTVRAENPGLFFWAENVYSIRDVSLDIDYQGRVDKVFNFSLSPEEYKKFDHLQLVYNVDESTAPLPPMRISLNGQTIYEDAPPVTSFNVNIARDIFGSPIAMSDRNSMVFSFAQEASYTLSDATMIVYYRSS